MTIPAEIENQLVQLRRAIQQRAAEAERLEQQIAEFRQRRDALVVAAALGDAGENEIRTAEDDLANAERELAGVRHTIATLQGEHDRRHAAAVEAQKRATDAVYREAREMLRPRLDDLVREALDAAARADAALALIEDLPLSEVDAVQGAMRRELNSGATELRAWREKRRAEHAWAFRQEAAQKLAGAASPKRRKTTKGGTQ